MVHGKKFGTLEEALGDLLLHRVKRGDKKYAIFVKNCSCLHSGDPDGVRLTFFEIDGDNLINRGIDAYELQDGELKYLYSIRAPICHDGSKDWNTRF